MAETASPDPGRESPAGPVDPFADQRLRRKAHRTTAEIDVLVTWHRQARRTRWTLAVCGGLLCLGLSGWWAPGATLWGFLAACFSGFVLGVLLLWRQRWPLVTVAAGGMGFLIAVVPAWLHLGAWAVPGHLASLVAMAVIGALAGWVVAPDPLDGEQIVLSDDTELDRRNEAAKARHERLRVFRRATAGAVFAWVLAYPAMLSGSAGPMASTLGDAPWLSAGSDAVRGLLAVVGGLTAGVANRFGWGPLLTLLVYGLPLGAIHLGGALLDLYEIQALTALWIWAAWLLLGGIFGAFQWFNEAAVEQVR